MICVTGASSGLGREVALRLSGRVVATARRVQRLEALAAETGGRVEPYVLDVTDMEGCDELVAHLLSEGCEGIILNAGVTAYEPYLEGEHETDERLVATNVMGNLRLLRGLADGWVARGVKGRVVIVASIGGLMPVPYQAVYAGTKAFMVNFGASVREELLPKGITVGVFAPGGIATEMTAGEDFANKAKHLAPVGDVAEALIAAYRSGDALVVPGAANKATVLAGRVIPRGVMAKLSERIFRKD